MKRWWILMVLAAGWGVVTAGDTSHQETDSRAHRETASPQAVLAEEGASSEPTPEPASGETITLSLEPGQTCFIEETQLVVDVMLLHAEEAINGGQFFLSYDTDHLSLQQVLKGDSPFTLPVYLDTSVPGQIDYAIGVGFGQPGTMADTRMASLVFTILDVAVLEPGLVGFRPHQPATRVTNELGASIEPALIDLPPISLQADPVDLDGDGVPFDCDACPNTIPGIAVDAWGCPPLILADYDRDGDVDDTDVDHFSLCKGRPTVPAPVECQDRDLDLDGDVDQSDFAAVQQCYSFQDLPAAAACHLE